MENKAKCTILFDSPTYGIIANHMKLFNAGTNEQLVFKADRLCANLLKGTNEPSPVHKDTKRV